MASSTAWPRALVGFCLLVMAAFPARAAAHPMGNFSISHYAGITVEVDHIELRYLIDMAEIPTFQAIQDAAIVAEPGHPSLGPFLAQQAKTLAAGLTLSVNTQRLPLECQSSTILFTPGAGG